MDLRRVCTSYFGLTIINTLKAPHRHMDALHRDEEQKTMLARTRFPFPASFFNGHRAVRAELRRDVNHAASISMEFVRRDVDGPTLSLGRGAE